MRCFKLLIIFTTFILFGCNEEVSFSKGVVSDLSSEQLLSAQFSKQGSLLLILKLSGQATVFNANNFNVEFEVPKNEELQQTRLALLSGDGSKLILANDNDVAIWSVSGKALIGKTQFMGVQQFAKISALAISDDNDKLIVGMSDGAINMATISTRLNNRFKPHTRPVTHISFLDNEKYWSASQDGKLAYRVFASAEPITEQEFAHRITSLVLGHDNNKMFVSDALKTQLVKPLTGQGTAIQLQYMARFMVFRQAYFINHADLLATSSSKNHLSLWDTQTGEELGTWQSQVETPTATILSMFSNDKGELLTINSDAMLEKWDLTQLNTL